MTDSLPAETVHQITKLLLGEGHDERKCGVTKRVLDGLLRCRLMTDQGPEALKATSD